MEITTADVWFGGGVDSYISAAELGYLDQYESPEAEAIDAGYRDKDGYWTGLALVPAGFLVNNDVLEEKGLEAPKTWEDLADPKYKDEIIMASPAISGTQYAILNGTLQPGEKRRAGRFGLPSMTTWISMQRAAVSRARRYAQASTESEFLP